MSIRQVIPGLVILALAGAGQARAQSEWTEVTRLDFTTPPSASSGFGASVASTWLQALIGAPDDDFAAPEAGAAYLFGLSFPSQTWQPMARLTSSDAVAGADFGASVGMGIAVNDLGSPVPITMVGDPGSGDSGSVYLFFPSLDQIARLQPSTNAGAEFGASLSVWEQTLAIGAPNDDQEGASAGAVYIYEHTAGSPIEDWKFVQKLTASDAQVGGNFGQSVALHGDQLVIGSPSADNPSDEAGLAYVFEKGASWTEVERLEPPGPQAAAHFGAAVAIRCGVAVVGEPDYSDMDAASRGAVHVFVRGKPWQHAQTLLATEGSADDDFGASLAMNATAIAVGDPGADPEGTDNGAAYIFEPVSSSVFEQVARLVGSAATGGSGDALGRAVSLSGERRIELIAGTPGDDESGADTGAAYVFRSSLVFGDSFNCGDFASWSQTIGD